MDGLCGKIPQKQKIQGYPYFRKTPQVKFDCFPRPCVDPAIPGWPNMPLLSFPSPSIQQDPSWQIQTLLPRQGSNMIPWGDGPSQFQSYPAFTAFYIILLNSRFKKRKKTCKNMLGKNAHIKHLLQEQEAMRLFRQLLELSQEIIPHHPPPIRQQLVPWRR